MAVIYRRPDVVVERGPRDTLRILAAGRSTSWAELSRADVDELVAALIAWQAGNGLRNVELRRFTPLRRKTPLR